MTNPKLSPTTCKELVRDYIAGKTNWWLSWDDIDRLFAIVAQGMPREATRRECGSGASAPASPVAESDAPNSAPTPGISGEDE